MKSTSRVQGRGKSSGRGRVRSISSCQCGFIDVSTSEDEADFVDHFHANHTNSNQVDNSMSNTDNSTTNLVDSMANPDDSIANLDDSMVNPDNNNLDNTASELESEHEEVI